MRVALEDLLHALVSTARDRVAGRTDGPLAAVSVEEAAVAMEAWEDLLPLVRRNLAPIALWTEAVGRLRRAAPRGKDP